MSTTRDCLNKLKDFHPKSYFVVFKKTLFKFLIVFLRGGGGEGEEGRRERKRKEHQLPFHPSMPSLYVP